jgi:hypothetical protein
MLGGDKCAEVILIKDIDGKCEMAALRHQGTELRPVLCIADNDLIHDSAGCHRGLDVFPDNPELTSYASFGSAGEQHTT